MASTAAVAARDNTGTNPSSAGVPVFLLDGTQLATGNAQLWSGSLLQAPDITELGTQLNAVVFTGTLTDGTAGAYSLGISPGDHSIYGNQLC